MAGVRQFDERVALERALDVFEEHAGRFLAGAKEAIDRKDKRSALLSFFDFCIDTVVAGSPSRGCLSTRTAVEAATEFERAETAVRAFLDKLEAVVHDGLAAIDDGLALNVDLGAAARLVVTTTRGIAVMERVHHAPAELRAIAATLVTSLVGH